MRNVISADYARIGRRGGLASTPAKRVVARGNVLKRWRRKPDAGILPLHRLRDGIWYLDHGRNAAAGLWPARAGCFWTVALNDDIIPLAKFTGARYLHTKGISPAGGIGESARRNDMQTKQPVRISAPAVDSDIKLTPEIHKEGDWYAATCPEVPEANGQGRTPEESVQDLKQGVLSIMQDRRADAFKNGKNGHCTPEPT